MSESPPVSHLLFIDDSFLFTRATTDNCNQVADILSKYELASGQKVNLLKSEICFSRNIRNREKSHLAALLGVDLVARHEKYLGLPTIMGINQQACFGFIKER